MTGLTTRELTSGTWDDFVGVLGSNGGARGCWCMHWRLSIAEWTDGRGDGNKRAMKSLARRKRAPGVVVYRDSTAVAWCSLGPRDEFPRLVRSPLLKPVDDEDVCAIACVLVARAHRRSGLLPSVLDAVCDYAAARDYPAVEGYPVDPPDGRRAGADTAMTGIASAFREAGFTEIARRRKDRPIMRRVLR
ncbi:GNAT family N-acetyltransferase [Mycolicibacterium flavescens]|uniref:N-acetyltransferase domain-containing protein n=1 Tax=Mycolicibacterium flavescens TaxID=1776 RepID=A0A1E3RRG5_MYCFV|nr:GNAT family N-acetyltransferase [Mycolicibacterium flavescens]MCV7279814.1 GNAT family N-acetyltransferase [Mycolicibacterium flavescens]ODQ92440.1 hypothetical protein BHQ18_01525 [Mycolicibacterium flavescens]